MLCHLPSRTPSQLCNACLLCCAAARAHKPAEAARGLHHWGVGTWDAFCGMPRSKGRAAGLPQRKAACPACHMPADPARCALAGPFGMVSAVRHGIRKQQLGMPRHCWGANKQGPGELPAGFGLASEAAAHLCWRRHLLHPQSQHHAEPSCMERLFYLPPSAGAPAHQLPTLPSLTPTYRAVPQLLQKGTPGILGPTP